MSKLVALEYLNDYDYTEIKKAFEKGFNSLNVKNFFKPQMKVLIKACLPEAASQDLALSTHPSVIRAIVDTVSNLGIKCIVADCPEKKFNEDYINTVYLNTGMLEMANLTSCELNKNLETHKVEIVDGVKTKAIRMLKILDEVDIVINVGKLKIDGKLGFLGATSNIFGVVPGEVKNLILNRLTTLSDFNNLIIDIYEKLSDKIVLNVLDGIVALEADKTPRMMNCLAMSESSYSLDATMFDILNINYENTFLKQAQNRNLFDFNKPYKLNGEKIDKFKVEDFLTTDFDNFTEIKHPKGYYNSHQRRVVINKNKCKGCKICSQICPTGAIKMKYDKNDELYAEIDYQKCIFCKKCLTACPYEVVELKTPIGYKNIMKEIEKHNK